MTDKVIYGGDPNLTQAEYQKILDEQAAWEAERPAREKADAERATRKAAVDTEAASDTFIDALRGATPDQIKTWVTNNVTDLPSAKAALAKLACAVAYALNGGTAK